MNLDNDSAQLNLCHFEYNLIQPQLTLYRTTSLIFVLCGDHLETANHLLLTCPYSRFVFGSVEEGPGFLELGADICETWVAWSLRRELGAQTCSPNLLAANWWVVWNCRNQTIFQLRNTDPLFAVSSVRCLLSHWNDLR